MGTWTDERGCSVLAPCSFSYVRIILKGAQEDIDAEFRLFKSSAVGCSSVRELCDCLWARVRCYAPSPSEMSISLGRVLSLSPRLGRSSARLGPLPYCRSTYSHRALPSIVGSVLNPMTEMIENHHVIYCRPNLKFHILGPLIYN